MRNDNTRTYWELIGKGLLELFASINVPQAVQPAETVVRQARRLDSLRYGTAA